MKFHYINPTRLFFGEKCVFQNAELLSRLGQKALIVMGRTSAQHNGAGNDIQAALKTVGITNVVFSGVEPDPSFLTVTAGAKRGRAEAVDFVIGVGGGSAIDAAKAMSVLIANPTFQPADLYTMPYFTAALPIVAVPTTAGTGTEVTPYSVLTDPDQQTKRGFAGYATFPTLALVDVTYTLSLPWEITLDTAVDALSHLIEGYISNKANVFTDSLAEKGFEIFRDCIAPLKLKQINNDIREKLMLASTLGGMVIAMAGTATVHALGYCLTYFNGIPHGRANGYLLFSQAKRCANVTGKVAKFLQWMDIQGLNGLSDFFRVLYPKRPVLSEKTMKEYAARAIQSKNNQNSPYPVSEEILFQMLEESCLQEA